MYKKFIPIIASAVLLCATIVPATAATQTLPNGAELVSQPLRNVPYASISILVKAGVIDETVSSAGWRQILAGAMMRGTTNGTNVLEGPQIVEAAEVAGGQIGVQVLDDAIAFTAAGDSSTQTELANLLLNVVLHPRLSKEDLAASRRSMLQNIEAARNNPVPDHSAATEMLQRQLYRNSVEPLTYGLPPAGTVDSLAGFIDQSARLLHQKFFTASNMVISLSGDVDEESLRKVFAQIPQGSPMPKRPLNYASRHNVDVIRMSTQNPWMLVGYRIDAKIADADLAALHVLTAALTDTSPSVLSNILLTNHDDKDHSLASSVSAQLFIRQHGSELMIAIESDAQHLAVSKNQVYAALQKAMDGIKAKPLTPEQLQAAIAYTEGNWAATQDSTAVRAVLTGYAKVQNTPSDWPALLRSVSAKEVQDAAQKHLANSTVVIAIPEGVSNE